MMLGILGLMMVPGADAPAKPTAMWSLPEKELRSRIVGKQIQTTDEPPPGLDYVTFERFVNDGRYFRSFHGHEELGTYRFENDMVCVRLDRRETCRTGLTDTNGDLWLLSKDQERTRIQRHAVSE